MELNIFIALLAGFLSFLSPCIFPLIPSYLGYIGAAEYKEGFEKSRGALPLILSFIAGFTIVFSLMGIAFSTLGFAFRDFGVIISRISGILVIILGLNTIFNFISFLDYEKKADYRIKNKGALSSLVLGMAFGAGWSPCIGPILASILFLAGSSDTLASGIIMLLFFSIGLGIPFLLTGIFISGFRERSKGIKKHMGKIKVISGLLIIFIGILIFFDRLSNINILLNQYSLAFSNWYTANSVLFNISTGVTFLLITLLQAVNILKRHKNGKHIIIPIIFAFLFLTLSIGSFTLLINWGNIIRSYLSFQGI